VAKAWAISGVDLHVDVAGTRVRAGLESALRDAVRSGQLPAGLRLPSSRQLAFDLGLARNTVAEAYGQLVAEGWLVARQGSGTRVAHRVLDRDNATPTATAVAAIPRYDLRAGSPDLSSFPSARWAAALRSVLASVPVEALGYGDPRGRPETREALAGYLARARGVRCDPERIVVCSGFAQGLSLLCSVLRAKQGKTVSTVAVEAYSLPAYRDILGARGVRPCALAVDSNGAAVESLTDEAAVLLTPAHQFPLGPSLAPARRAAAVSWAVQSDGLVLEDDYDGEFRYDRHPLGAVQALAPDHVAYLGTASKTLAPGLRLGWLVLPRPLVEPVVAAKSGEDYTGVLEQLTLARFITSGGYDRHVRRRRLVYHRRRDALLQALARSVPDATVTGVAAGLHALVRLPDGVSEEAVIAGAARSRLAIGGLAPYRVGVQDHPPALVVGYATPPDHAYTGALARLTATLAPATGVGRG
jgi:GntR family transcriptional regulator/MocR family aminotransferase